LERGSGLGIRVNNSLFCRAEFPYTPPHTMNMWRTKKPSAIICVALGVFLIFLLIYGRPLTTLCLMRWNSRAKPELWIVPTPLTDVSVAHSPGRNFIFYGYQFEAPWTVNREAHLKNEEIVYFSNNLVMVFHDPAQNGNELKILTGEGTQNEVALKRLWGEEATSSNYAMRSKILNLTPRDLHLSFSRQKMVSSSVLLMLKPLSMGTSRGGLYSFQTEWLRGFQLGDPTRDKTITIDAFDLHDREIELFIGRGQGASRNVTQAELNRTIYSLRPTLASQTQ